MTVKHLIKELKKCQQDAIVVLSRDEEGSGFAPVAVIQAENTVLSCTWNVGLKTLTPEYEELGYTDEDVIVGQDAVVLWPE